MYYSVVWYVLAVNIRRNDIDEIKSILGVRTRPEFRFQWNLGRYRFRSGTGRFGRYQTGSVFFLIMLDYKFSLFSTNWSPVSRVTQQYPGWITCKPSSSQTVLRATLQFRLYHVLHPVPCWITCIPSVHRLYNVLPSSSQTISRAPLQFPG